MTKPIVFHNRSCPVCRAEISHYQRLDAEAGTLDWRNVGEPSQEPAMRGIDPDQLRRRLHVLAADGRVLVGVDAFAHIWERLPRYRWLARLVRWRPVHTVASLLYEPLAAGLYAMDRRRRRKAMAASAGS